MRYTKEEMQEKFNKLPHEELILFEKTMELTHIFEKYKFIHGINFEYYIKQNDIDKMKELCIYLKNVDLNKIKKILEKIGFSNNKYLSLLEAIDFIKKQK